MGKNVQKSVQCVMHTGYVQKCARVWTHLLRPVVRSPAAGDMPLPGSHYISTETEHKYQQAQNAPQPFTILGEIFCNDKILDA